MKIFDLEGKPFIVTNLEEAIAQATLFRDYQHEDPEFEKLNNKLKTYWSDFLDKLLKLRTGETRLHAKK